MDIFEMILLFKWIYSNAFATEKIVGGAPAGRPLRACGAQVPRMQAARGYFTFTLKVTAFVAFL